MMFGLFGAAVGDHRLAVGVAPLEVELERLARPPPSWGSCPGTSPWASSSSRRRRTPPCRARGRQEDAGDRQVGRDRAAERSTDLSRIASSGSGQSSALMRAGRSGSPTRRRSRRAGSRERPACGAALVVAVHDRDRRAALARWRRRRRLAAAAAAPRRSPACLRCASAKASFTLGGHDPLRQLDGRDRSPARATKLWSPFSPVLEARDVDGAQVDVGAGHDRVVVEPAFFPATSASSSVRLAASHSSVS